MADIKLRSAAGGSLALTVDPTLATDEVLIMNEAHGIESGGTTNATHDEYYVKYPDGTMTAYGEFQYTSSVLGAGGQTVNMGVTFVGKVSGTASLKVLYTSSTNTFVNIQAWCEDNANSIKVKANVNTNGAVTVLADNSATHRIQWQAIGRWK